MAASMSTATFERAHPLRRRGIRASIGRVCSRRRVRATVRRILPSRVSSRCVDGAHVRAYIPSHRLVGHLHAKCVDPNVGVVATTGMRMQRDPSLQLIELEPAPIEVQLCDVDRTQAHSAWCHERGRCPAADSDTSTS